MGKESLPVVKKCPPFLVPTFTSFETSSIVLAHQLLKIEQLSLVPYQDKRFQNMENQNIFASIQARGEGNEYLMWIFHNQIFTQLETGGWMKSNYRNDYTQD